MKVLKVLVITLAIIILIPLIVAIFMKKDYGVEREVIIKKSSNEVFDYIKYLKNQHNYSKWSEMDPNMEKIYTGTDATIGFVSRWESTNPDVGKGEQEIVNIVDGQRIDYELRFIEPFQSTEKGYMLVEAVSPDQTKVKWGFNGHIGYPMNFVFLFINFEEMIGADLSTGLNNLKKVLEAEE